mgnify:CR=1 FL=1
MRQDAVTLQRFYASPLGSAAARILSAKLVDLWGEANNLSVLGLGYAIPVLDAFGDQPGRSVAAVPFDHGPVRWDPTGRGNATVSVGDLRLPFPDGQFDRVIVLHGLEETGDPRAYLREIWRVMAPEGRIVLAVSNRAGLWSRATRTPFGQGRPWSRSQLMNLLSIGLFAAAEGWDAIGRIITPGLGGVVLVEAVKRLYAEPGGGAVAPVAERVRIAKPAATSRREKH